MSDTTTSTVVILPLDVASIQAEAANELNTEVQAEVIAKFKTVAVRQQSIDTLNAYHNGKVAGLTAAITAATTAEQIRAAINSPDFSFAPRYYKFITETTEA